MRKTIDSPVLPYCVSVHVEAGSWTRMLLRILKMLRTERFELQFDVSFGRISHSASIFDSDQDI